MFLFLKQLHLVVKPFDFLHLDHAACDGLAGQLLLVLPLPQQVLLVLFQGHLHVPAGLRQIVSRDL